MRLREKEFESSEIVTLHLFLLLIGVDVDGEKLLSLAGSDLLRAKGDCCLFTGFPESDREREIVGLAVNE